ncbi:DUF4349 domain-containing protein [Microbacterium album]|uniref:DUF4349 domain-containing protein n=1 Tax=Microbacterium album TaxID=2053191 RepID=A0A917ICX3_9MICO|nr:DUF4349 domain-containing protein [Microbacterium album]GGH39764.1 hypothetical protein GCM10010921_11240 [Microbacterium album]
MSANDKPADAAPEALPDVSEETLERMEARVFDAIADHRASQHARGRRRRRLWQGGAVAAAIVAVAAVISPAVMQGISGSGSGGATIGVTSEAGPGMPEIVQVPAEPDPLSGGDVGDGGSGAVREDAAVSPGTSSPLRAETAREVARTATAVVVVDDVEHAADAVAGLAAEHGGWVEQLSVGGDRRLVSPHGEYMPIPVPDDGGYVSIRVPAESLEAAMAALDDLGEVSSSRVHTEDVTTQALDLRARVDAARAFVERLQALLAEAASVSDLVEVETALAQRQSELESLEQQLEHLDGRVTMSALAVSLVTDAPPVEPDPTGFADGLRAGWNGLLATVNGIVVALGFLLPWVAVLGFTGAVVWAVARLVRRARRARDG